MTSSNRFLKFVCLFTVVSLLLFIPDMGVWAGTTGKISGIVTDAESGEPLPGANVLIDGTTLGAATDLDGFYFILNIPPGEHSVRATMIGYTAVIQQQVRVNADRNTPVSFDIKPAVLESDEAVVVIAERPLVERDVASSQSITTSETAEVIPVSDIMQAVSLEPGVSVTENIMEVQIRDTNPNSSQVRFQVDGMERKDKLNDKIYTPTNSATVAEIQVLTGGFNAEYGNLRSGMFNVISREGGRRLTGSVDYRMAPGQYKHFGPDAYGTDQYEWKTYGTASSFNPIVDVNGNPIFVGWDSLATVKNASTYLGRNDWSAKDLQDIWKYRHRGYEYADVPDHYIDAGLGGPIPLEGIGIREAGFFLGAKYNTIASILPAARDMDEILSLEGKIHFKATNNIKVVLSGLWGQTTTSTNGLNWGSLARMDYGYNTVSAALGQYKYYLSAYDILDMTTSQFGAKLTHSLSPSTFYEVRYNYFSTETEAGRGTARNTSTVTNINGVGFDEGPVGWVSDQEPVEADLTGRYRFYGAGLVSDTSYVKTHLINVDLTSQISNQHLVKVGVELGMDHVVRDNKVAGTIIGEPESGHFVNFDRKPFHLAGYIQDKIEYGGLIANIGLRVEHYNAKGYIYDPGNIFTMLWARGGTAGYESPDDLPKEESKSFTYLAPRISFSHPVGEYTKFFFNYGVYYNEPTNADRYAMFSESWVFGHPQGDIRRVGYANLEAPRTAAYEVGFEQSIGTDWLIRAYFYSKDNSEQIGHLRVEGLGGSHGVGDFGNYAGVGKEAAAYDSRRNNGWQDLRGVEMKVTKRTGRYFTGWLNMNYLVNTSGNYGLEEINQDPLIAANIYTALKEQPQTQPSFIANFNFHTPSDFGSLWGDWRLSIIQTWAQGVKYIYNPTGLPTRDVTTIYYWVDNYKTNLRLSKSLRVLDNLGVRLYLDINNLFNYRGLNLSNLDAGQQRRYLEDVVDGDTGLGREIGEYEDNQGSNVFTENWVDRNGANQTPIAPERDFGLWYYPRSFLLGIKVEF